MCITAKSKKVLHINYLNIVKGLKQSDPSRHVFSPFKSASEPSSPGHTPQLGPHRCQILLQPPTTRKHEPTLAT